jgi:tetratricopeptide (TPR) repeat protein
MKVNSPGHMLSSRGCAVGEAGNMKRHLSFVAALGMCLFALNATAYAQVRADSGSIAIGGSVTGSTVIIGIPQEKVDELVREAKRPLEELTTQQRENITLLREKLDLNERQVRAALGILGENDIPPERLAAKLVEIAGRFKDLQATASAQPGDDPKITALKTDAQKAIEIGELAKADALLADVETEQRRALDRLAVNAAETSAQRGEIALTRLRYAEAAKHFANAAAVFPPNSAHEDKRISHLTNEANALYQQGEELGDNSALLLAIERRRRLTELITSERAPLEWPRVQNALGIALFTLGEREGGTARLEEAITIHREVLTQPIRESLPHEWATAQSGVANALQVIGMLEGGTLKLEQAVAAYQEALKERTRERAPLQWAATQNNLGSALASLGELQSRTAKLEEAVAAFREALKERTRERTPIEWAQSFGNEGVALILLAERRADVTMAEAALKQINTAFEVTREHGAPSAVYYEMQLLTARAVIARLRSK